MKLRNDILEHRLGLLQKYITPLRLTRLGKFEVFDHLLQIDIHIHNEAKEFTDEQMEECRKRFMEFCQTQVKNRN